MNIPLIKENKASNEMNLKLLWQVRRKLYARKEAQLYQQKKILLDIIDIPVNDIVEYFNYLQMKDKHTEFCPLYSKNQTCHKMDLQDLNCFGCMCPNYLLEIGFDQQTGLYKLGYCKLKTKHGFYKRTTIKDEDKAPFLILNCLNCFVPHQTPFVLKYIKKEILKLQSTL
jgi:hypothetical protein